MQLTSAPLVAFLTALALPTQADETAERLSFSARVNGQAVKDLDYEVVSQLVDCYGRAMTAEFLLEDLRELEIGPEITGQDFEEKKTNFASSSSYELRLRINKQALLNQVLGPDAARGSIHYFFATSVEKVLAQGLNELEKAIWPDVTSARRLIIGDTDLQRSGPAFHVIGGANLNRTLPPLGTLPESISSSIERMRVDREEQISWDYQWVRRLTPIQLQLDGKPGDSRLEKLFAAAYVQLCLLFTCNRARRRPNSAGRWQAQLEYQGGHSTVRIPLYEAQSIVIPISGTTVRGFASLTDWCYRLRDEGTTRDWAPDRLQFTQVRIAQALEPMREVDRLVTLIDQVDDVVTALDDQWRAFIEDRFGQYLDKERQLEGLINEVIVKFGEKTAALAKSLSDTMLAAVAVLIGSAIAAAFMTPFNAALFRVGVLAYAGYVLLFPGMFGLGSQGGEFIEITRAFDHETARFNALLGQRTTAQIIDNRITSARTRYWRWFGFTIAGYVVAIAGAVVAAILVPSIAA